MANTTNFAVEKPTVGGYRNSWGGTLNVALDKITELLALALPIGTIQMHTAAAAPTATGNGGTWLICDGTAISRTTYSALFSLIGTTYGVGDGSNTFNVPDLRSRSPIGYNTASLSGRSTRAIAANGGTETHTLLDAEIPKHTHPITDSGHIHATTEANHEHTGTTASSTTGITIPDHHHPLSRRTAWGDGNYDTSFENGGDVADTTTGTASLTPNDSGHTHSFTAGGAKTNLTINNATTSITVNEQGSGDGTHNNMQPFLVVNYIILAKHPSF